MSFSSQVKKELAALVPENACCMKAQAYGMLEAGRGFSRQAVSLQTENAHVAACYARMLQEVCDTPHLLCQEPPANAAVHKAYHTVLIPAEKERIRVLEQFGHSAEDVALRLNRANLDCEACPSAYLRGAFLACGAVTDPQNDYHMEFNMPYFNLSRDLVALLREMGLSAKMVQRKGTHVVYLKESEQIEDCLTMMGAQNAAMEMMNVKILKDIRNTANRITNCENANIDKTVAASMVQVEAVSRIEQTCGLDALPEDLRELAQLRMENPEMSLRELGECLSQPLSRSGVNHRLKRILEFADKLS